MWYSANKSKADTTIILSSVKQVLIGQTTPTFQAYPLPMLSHLSLSLILPDDSTLDLTCKDEFEFDTWVCGLKALTASNCGKLLSKQQLLAHSRRFKRAVEKNKDPSFKLSSGVEEHSSSGVEENNNSLPKSVALEDCIDIATLSPKECEAKISTLFVRVRDLKMQHGTLLETGAHGAAEMEVDVGMLTGMGAAYGGLVLEEGEAEADDMELTRCGELIQSVMVELAAAKRMLGDNPESAKVLGKPIFSDQQNSQREVDQLLWKLEVDVENIEDILRRESGNGCRGVATLWDAKAAEASAAIGKRLAETSEVVGETAKGLWEGGEKWFGEAWEKARIGEAWEKGLRSEDFLPAAWLRG